jgi:hypothetical protein
MNTHPNGCHSSCLIFGFAVGLDKLLVPLAIELERMEERQTLPCVVCVNLLVH